MKELTAERLAIEATSLLDVAQREGIVITRNGKPSAVLLGIENKDEEDWYYQTSSEFWRMIEDRRKEKGIPWEEVKARLFSQQELEVLKQHDQEITP